MKFEFENFKIVTDEMQFIVQEKKIVKEGRFTKPENIGNITWRDIAYCRDLDYAIKVIGRQILLENDDLTDIKNKLDLLNNKVSEMIKLLGVSGGAHEKE